MDLTVLKIADIYVQVLGRMGLEETIKIKYPSVSYSTLTKLWYVNIIEVKTETHIVKVI